ncbi:PilZ domain-containing protein [Sphingomonas colocasiae]|uniref:PilZ domain-containing protein n=1 Tax=Sphingomonas colocasiae TaxID=1848973 RepID=A0ABS7PI39_9SPHN|nr:PilZ domain-containing protein [Sphingomonas colocasiae]
MEQPIKIHAAGKGQNREAARDSLFLTAVVKRLADRSERTVRVRNLSAGGMMADCTEIFARDEAISIILRGVGEVSGRVAWRSIDKIGITFDNQIDPKRARKPVGTAKSDVPQHIRVAQVRRPGLKID